MTTQYLKLSLPKLMNPLNQENASSVPTVNVENHTQKIMTTTKPESGYEFIPGNDTPISAKEETRRGELIASMLNIKKNKDGKYETTWGTKTDLGLFRTMTRIVLDGE